MNVTRWRTPAAHFPWPQVQRSMDRIDETVYLPAIEYAQGQFIGGVRACPRCRTPPSGLFWVSVTDAEPAWDAGKGRVGFLTVCKSCKLQVDFVIDPELTEMQAEQWRQCRTLS